jgi:hypothetical protein
VVLRFQSGHAPGEAALVEILGEHDVDLGDLSYSLTEGGEIFEYQGNVETRRRHGLRDLSDRLKSMPGLVEYQLSRISK